MYRSLLVRNEGRGAWDPARGALSTYVYVVCRSVESHIMEAGRTRDRGPKLGTGADAALSYHAKVSRDPGRADLASLAFDLAEDFDFPPASIKAVLSRLLHGQDPWSAMLAEGLVGDDAAELVKRFEGTS